MHLQELNTKGQLRLAALQEEYQEDTPCCVTTAASVVFAFMAQVVFQRGVL
jgi:hypothetical protein